MNIRFENIKYDIIINRESSLFPSSFIHKHSYCEVHVIANGSMKLSINCEEIRLESNQAILIPANTYHEFTQETESLMHYAFKIKTDYDELVKITLPDNFANSFFEKLELGIDKAANHLLFIYNELINNITVTKSQIDYGYTVGEFFSTNYNKDVTLSNLSKELNLSNMQTQRVVKKYTGKTFKQNLITQRMLIADALMKKKDMSPEEISEYVGYDSYNGFRKAYKKFKEENSER